METDGTRPEDFMRQAIHLACEQVEAGGGPFGAVVVHQGRIIAQGANQVTLANDPTAHAEIVAIRAACQALGRFDLRGCEVYSSCEPCPMCLSALHWARVDRVIFAADRHDAARIGFDDALLYQELSLPIGKRRLKSQQMLGKEGLEPFVEWIQKTDRKIY